MKVCIILGTSPEIIKMSPIVRVEKRDLEFFILHTGQHYSYNMDQIFFEQLKLPHPKYNLKVGSGTYAEETILNVKTKLRRIYEWILQNKDKRYFHESLCTGDIRHVLMLNKCERR